MGGGGGAHLGAVDEIQKHVAAFRGPALRLRRPSVERRRGIAGRLLLDAAAQAQINKIAGQFVESGVLLVIDDRDSDAMLAQQIEKRRCAKALMPDLDDMAERAPADLPR